MAPQRGRKRRHRKDIATRITKPMKPSKLDLSDVLQAKLLEFPSLVTELEQRQPAFMEHLRAWMLSLEEIFKLYGIPQAAEIAGVRSKMTVPAYTELGRAPLRKAQLKAAAEALDALQQTVMQVAQPIAQRIEECNEVVLQLLAISRVSGELPNVWNIAAEYAVYNLWDALLKVPQFHGGVVKLQTHFPLEDIFRLFVQEMQSDRWELQGVIT